MGRSEGDGRLIRRIKAKGDDNWVVVKWEYADGPVEVVVVKSETGPAKDLRQLFVERPDHRAIFFDEGTRCQDQDVVSDVRYYYTLFAQDHEGRWRRQGDAKVHVPRNYDRERVEFHEPGTVLAKLDKMRAAMLGPGTGPF
jgi:hypothetical protein